MRSSSRGLKRAATGTSESQVERKLHAAGSFLQDLPGLCVKSGLGVIDCCAIGSDYDGMNRCPVGLEDSSKLQGIAAGLSELGLSDEDIDKVMYRNMANYVGKFTD